MLQGRGERLDVEERTQRRGADDGEQDDEAACRRKAAKCEVHRRPAATGGAGGEPKKKSCCSRSDPRNGCDEQQWEDEDRERRCVRGAVRDSTTRPDAQV